MGRGFNRKNTSQGARLAAEAKAAEAAPAPKAEPFAGAYLGREDDPKSVIGIEKKIRSEKVEHGAGFAPDGTLLFEQTDNNEGSISFSQQNMRKLYENPNGVLTHNHPSSRPFSVADVIFLLTANLSEIRAVGEDYEYKLQDPKGEFRSKFTNPKSERMMFVRRDEQGNAVEVPIAKIEKDGTRAQFRGELYSNESAAKIGLNVDDYIEKNLMRVVSEFPNHPRLDHVELVKRELMHEEFKAFAARHGLVYTRTRVNRSAPKTEDFDIGSILA